MIAFSSNILHRGHMAYNINLSNKKNHFLFLGRIIWYSRNMIQNLHNIKLSEFWVQGEWRSEQILWNSIVSFCDSKRAKLNANRRFLPSKARIESVRYIFVFVVRCVFPQFDMYIRISLKEQHWACQLIILLIAYCLKVQLMMRPWAPTLLRSGFLFWK